MYQESRLAVVYSTDDNYAKYLGISMYSLFQSNTAFAAVTVYVMDCGIQAENRQKLEQIAQQWGREIVFVPMAGMLDTLDLHMGAHKISLASYARLFLARVIPDSEDRVLYLDCDTLVCDSLGGLWATVMGNALIAGVQDTVDKYFQKVIGLAPAQPYINAGILLVNLKAWREEDITSSFFAVVERFGGNVPHHDQGCINCVCADRRLRVDVRYNFTSNMYSFSADTIQKIYFLDDFYTQEAIDAAIAHPAIVHFTTGLVGRPWEENCTHPMQQAFREAASHTVWADLPLLPDSRKRGLKAFTAFYQSVPRPLFVFAYRRACWLLHLRK